MEHHDYQQIAAEADKYRSNLGCNYYDKKTIDQELDHTYANRLSTRISFLKLNAQPRKSSLETISSNLTVEPGSRLETCLNNQKQTCEMRHHHSTHSGRIIGSRMSQIIFITSCILIVVSVISNLVSKAINIPIHPY